MVDNLDTLEWSVTRFLMGADRDGYGPLPTRRLK